MTSHDDLRAAAEAATPGPWRVYNRAGHYGVEGERFHVVHAHSDQHGWGVGSSERDARFIAAADPPTVLGLLDLIDRLRDALGEIAAERCGIPGHAVAVGCGCPERARAALADQPKEEGNDG